jgi:chorismate synthase
MRGNSIGQSFRLTTFGESHGAAIGGVLDGCPAGLHLDVQAVQVELDRRRPGSTPLGTARTEADRVEWLSGLHNGATLGTPIAFLIRNRDARPADYDALKDVYRPGHADRSWEQKFGLRDHRGGGRSSARTTAACVVGGAIARQVIAPTGTRVAAYVDQVGNARLATPLEELDLARVFGSDVRCPDPTAAAEMIRTIELARTDGDSVGGAITLVVQGLPPGLGEPVFDKLHADLGKALLSINAVKGFEIGAGFASAGMRGSAHNALPSGVQGGISTGAAIVCRLAFKPASTIAKPQQAVDKEGKEVVLEARGRHDPCVVPRAVPIVEAMACLTLADHLLRQRTARI